MARSLRSWISERQGRDSGGERLPPPTSVLEALLRRGPAGASGCPPVLLVVVGKGGTGKTTVAGSLALGLVDRGFRVLAASIDPAHNLGDVLRTPLSSEPSAVLEGGLLLATEVDTERALQDYLDRTSREVRHTYRYLQVLNLDRFLGTLRFAPGVEEQATMEAIGELLVRAGREGCDAWILDTPPTGLTMRVLALPTVSVRWAQELQRVRREILKKREVIERVVGPEEAIIGEETVRIPSDEADDAVSQILKKYLAEASDLMRLLSDTSRTGVILVRNPDRLSGIESRHALVDLGRLEIPLAMIVWNKAAGTEAAPASGTSPEKEAFPAEESGYAVRRLPLVAEEPSGPDALRDLSTLLLSN